jgi:hypothetical protein
MQRCRKLEYQSRNPPGFLNGFGSSVRPAAAPRQADRPPTLPRRRPLFAIDYIVNTGGLYAQEFEMSSAFFRN